MALTIYVNTGSSDVEYGTSGYADWYQFVPGVDYLIHSAGNATVADGQPIPSESELISAGVILSGAETTVSTYFLADVGSNILREIPLMGNQNYQYVLAFSFSAATASEPVLELWDDNTYATIAGVTLGSGTASNSWWRGITTTTSSSGVNWVGSRLAGSGAGNYLLLNDGNGVLSVADVLYCQIKIVIPASQTTGGNVVPPFVVKHLSAS
jgi:hypothetical protein